MVFRFLLLFLIAFPVFGAEVAGVTIPDADQQLLLNGAGLRTHFFFQVYAIGLYLPEKKAAAADAIGAAGPKRVAIYMLRDVGADQFADALTDGMKDNVSEAEMKAFEPRLKQLVAIMAEVKEAKKGQRITLDWLPADGTQVTVGGKTAGAPIPGEDFYRALLKIWLGDNPVQSDLKRALLGEMRGEKQ
ncbi:MAG TPA: chalcone isomerase family protein [Burkholderiales bacterium]|nr:chalcone isomerase family protein [Burkholderiales bacterium]